MVDNKRDWENLFFASCHVIILSIFYILYVFLLKHVFYVAAIESENGIDQEQENETQIDAASPSSSVSIYFNISNNYI